MERKEPKESMPPEGEAATTAGISRRTLLTAAAAAPFVTMGCAAGGGQLLGGKREEAPFNPNLAKNAKGKKPPNIVLMVLDQQKASAVGYHGNPVVPSAFQDRMAAEGISFRHAYTNSAVCTPSRASLMTGVQPLVHQATCVQNRVPYNLDQLPELLMRKGYFNAACGHYEPRRDLTRGWHTEIDQNAAGDLYASWADWIAPGRRDVSWSTGPLERPADQGNSALLTDWMIRSAQVGHEAGAPMFLHLALNDPHPPYWVPRPYDTMVDPMDVVLPPMPDPTKAPPWHEKLIEDNGSNLATEMDRRLVKSVYYGMVAYANDQMQRLHEELVRLGEIDNTWIIITSDHGDYTGEHNAFAKSESLYECLLHVPMTIVPPRGMRAPRGIMVDGFVDLTDVFATILGIAGADIPEYCQGHDLMKWVRDGAREPLRDVVHAQVGDYHGNLGTTWPGGLPASGRHPSLLVGGRTMDFSYTRDPDYGDEAYDLRENKWELENLLNPGMPPPPPQVDALRRRVDANEQECLDLRAALGIKPGDRGFWDGIQHQEDGVEDLSSAGT